MSEQPPTSPHESQPDGYGWEDVARDMANWHPALQPHAQRHLEQRGLTPEVEAHTSDASIASGRNVTTGEIASLAEGDVEPISIDRSDIRAHAIGVGETELVLQRHGKYIRDVEDPNAGSLTPEAFDLEHQTAKNYFESFLEQTPAEERNNVHVLFVASDTAYQGRGQRSYETALIAEEAAKEVFEDRGIPVDNIINIEGRLKGGGGPRPMANLREPQMFSQSPEFVELLRTKYGDVDKNFWIAFEEDVEHEQREEMGAEGPDQIADRMAFSVRVLARYASEYHAANPGVRLIVVGGTHYDTISPYVKRDVLHMGKEQPVLVDYGGGITVDIDRQGNAITEIGDVQYPVPLRKAI